MALNSCFSPDLYGFIECRLFKNATTPLQVEAVHNVHFSFGDCPRKMLGFKPTRRSDYHAVTVGTYFRVGEFNTCQLSALFIVVPLYRPNLIQ